jgi:hypothetical protein
MKACPICERCNKAIKDEISYPRYRALSGDEIEIKHRRGQIVVSNEYFLHKKCALEEQQCNA